MPTCRASRARCPRVLDVEWNHTSKSCPDQPAPTVIRAEIQAYLSGVARHYGQQPILYTTPDFWRDNDLRQLQGEQPWLRSVAAHPSEIYPGEHWAFWQYSGTGLVPGIEGEVDLNAFSGSRYAWKAWLHRNAL